MNRLPRRIETFDISHVQGTDTVASMVLCVNGEMKRNGYRKFKIESVKGPDDFAAMREVVHRHYENVLEQDEGNLPDLVLIDGGKGQLSAAVSALDDLGLGEPGGGCDRQKGRDSFRKGKEDHPIELPKDSPVLHLIQMMRDEAHRFAVAYHRKRRELRDFDSELMDIPGIGEVRKKVLLRAFGSLERVKQAAFDELAPYVGPKAASQIIRALFKKAGRIRSRSSGFRSQDLTCNLKSVACICLSILITKFRSRIRRSDRHAYTTTSICDSKWQFRVKWPASDPFRICTLPVDVYVAGVEMEGTATLAVQGQILYLNGPKSVRFKSRNNSAGDSS